MIKKVLALLLLTGVSITQGQTLGDDCSSDATICDSITGAECATATTPDSCQCTSTYTDSDGDGTTTAGGTCNPNVGTDCTAGTSICADSNAACGGTAGTSGSATCVCNLGYYSPSGTCVAVVASGCTSESDCTGRDYRTTCTSSACACASGYFSNGGFCTLALGSSCTDDTTGDALCTTRGVTNSDCTAGLQCICATGYTASYDLTSCSLSGADQIQPAILTLVLLVLTALYKLV